MVFCSSNEVPLSKIQVLVDRVFSSLMHAYVIVCACLFLMGVPNIALESRWYNIKIYSFPLLDLYGKRPVRSMNVLSLMWIMV